MSSKDLTASSNSSSNQAVTPTPFSSEPPTNDEKLLSTQPKFKAYCDDILNALDQFDKVKEWADLIKCLQKIIKVLGKYPQYNVIPYKLTFGKRLAQCLNRQLPSGVHLKSLEVYELAFSKLEVTVLASDMPIYSIGLYPLFQYASTQVKNKLLELFEKYYLPLKQDLFPTLSGLVLALLPALEEETSEFYHKVLTLMDHICKATDIRIFYRAVWKALLSSPNTRLAALNYLIARLPKDVMDFTPYVPEIGAVVITALEQSLLDSNILVQRTALEVINVFFPMHKKMFNTQECARLAHAALLVVTRREMSLNRRLFSWLSGGDEISDYFNKNSREVVILAVKAMFEAAPDPAFNSIITSYKVVMSLLDREDIGASIIDDVLIFILRSMYKYREATLSHKIIKTVALLFDQLQPQMFWTYIENLMTKEFSGLSENSSLESLLITDTVIDVLPLKDIEVQTIYLPSMLNTLVFGLQNILDAKNFSQMIVALQLVLKIFGKMHLSASFDGSVPENTLRTIQKCSITYEEFYTQLVLSRIIPSFETYKNKDPLSPNDLNLKIYELACKMLVSMHFQFRFQQISQEEFTYLPKWFECTIKCCGFNHPMLACQAIKTFIELINQPLSPLFNYVTKSTNYTSVIAKKIWSLFDPSLAIVHYQAAELFVELSNLCDDVCSEIIVEQMIGNDISKRVVEGYQRFALLWRLTGELGISYKPFLNTLFLMLDSLNDDQPMIKLVGRTWLGDSIIKVERILDPLLVVLLDQSTIRLNGTYQQMYDTRHVLHVWRILKVIIECDFKLFMQHVIEKAVSKDVLTSNEKQVMTIVPVSEGSKNNIESSDFAFMQINNYLDLLVVTALRFIQGRVPESFSPEFSAQNAVVQTSSAEFLQYLVLKITDPKKASEIANMIQEPVLANLAEAVSNSNLVLQVQLLGLLRAVVILDSYSSIKDPQMESESIRFSPMFLQTLVIGLLQPSSKNIRFYWLEFITSCLNYLEGTLPTLIPPIVKSICNIIQSDTDRNVYDSISAKDILTLVRTLYVFFDYSKLEAKRETSLATTATNALGAPVRMFTDFVRVFQMDTGSKEPQLVKTKDLKDALIRELPTILQSLIQVWGPPAVNQGFSKDGELHNKYAIQDQVLQILEPLFRSNPVPVLESLMLVWVDNPSESPNVQISTVQEIILEILANVEAGTPSLLLSSTCSILNSLHSQMGISSTSKNVKKEKKLDENLARKETGVLELIEFFISRIVSSDKLTPAWNSLLDFLKESVNSSQANSTLGALRILEYFIKKVSLPDDRRFRRDLQDVTQRLLETAGIIAGKSFGIVTSSQQNIEVQPTVEVSSSPKETVELPDSPVDNFMQKQEILPVFRMNVTLKALVQLSTTLAPMLDVIFDEKNDRVAGIITGILHNLIPHIKDRSSGSFQHATTTVSVLASLCDYPYTIRALRKDVLDAFMDVDFFLINYESLAKWKVVIDQLMTKDKTAFADFLKLLNSQPNIFTNRENDNIQRAKNMKRLSFILYSGQLDQYLNSLPMIQKFIEVLKGPNMSPTYIQELFLCLRVLLIRFSPANLRKFWPSVLTELIRIFSEPSSNEPQVILAACKFLDMLMVVPPEEFTYYEWMFVADSLVASVQSKTLNFQPYIQRMTPVTLSQSLESVNQDVQSRKPLIHLRSIDDLKGKQDLSDFVETFVSKWSAHVYVNSTSGKAVDTNFVHRIIEDDFIEYKSLEVDT